MELNDSPVRPFEDGRAHNSEINVMDNASDDGFHRLNGTGFLKPETIQWTAWIIVDVCLIVLIISGNILTICTLKMSRKLSAVVSNQFICSLAFSDLFVGLMLPYHLAFNVTESLGKNKMTCLIRFAMIVLACCASIYNLLAIAADRYIAIVYPLHYNRFMTRRMTAAIISAGWMSAVTLASCPVYWNLWNGRAECTLLNVLPANYVLLVLAPTFASIWLALLILYWRIWREARGHTERLRHNSHSGAPPADTGKSVQVVLLILGCFSVCWLPFFIVMIAIKAFHMHTNILYELTFTLAMANSGINPAIYTWKNAGFRAAFLQLLYCRTPNLSDHQLNHVGRKDTKSSTRSLNGVCRDQRAIEAGVVTEEKGPHVIPNPETLPVVNTHKI